MKLKILAFAQLKDYFPAEFEVELPADGCVADVVKQLKEQKPESEATLQTCRFALAEEMVTAEQSLQHGQSLAILPPSSGG